MVWWKRRVEHGNVANGPGTSRSPPGSHQVGWVVQWRQLGELLDAPARLCRSAPNTCTSRRHGRRDDDAAILVDTGDDAGLLLEHCLDDQRHRSRWLAIGVSRANSPRSVFCTIRPIFRQCARPTRAQDSAGAACDRLRTSTKNCRN